MQVNLTSGYSLSTHPQQHLAAALAAAQQQPRVTLPISVSLAGAHAPATMTLAGLSASHSISSGKPSLSEQHVTQTVYLSPPATGSPSGAPNLALNLATNNHPAAVPMTPTTPVSIASISGLPMMAVKLDASSNPHLAASIGVKRHSSFSAPINDFRPDGEGFGETGTLSKEKNRRLETPERRPAAASMD